VPYRISTHDLPTRIVVTIPTTLSRLPRWLVVQVSTGYIQTYHTVGISTQYHVKCVDKLQDCTSHYMAPGGLCTDNYVGVLHNCMSLVHWDSFKYSGTPFIRINPLTPNDFYIGRTATLTSKRFILYIYSTNTGTEYFKHGIYSLFFLFKMQFVS